jgi:hypothetical protein
MERLQFGNGNATGDLAALMGILPTCQIVRQVA